MDHHLCRYILEVEVFEKWCIYGVGVTCPQVNLLDLVRIGISVRTRVRVGVRVRLALGTSWLGMS